MTLHHALIKGFGFVYFPHPDFHIWSGLLERESWVTVDAGAWAVDEGDRNVRLNLPYPVQHGSLCPSVRDGHVPEGCLSTETIEHGWSSTFDGCHSAIGPPGSTVRCPGAVEGFKGTVGKKEWVNIHSPGSLGVQMVDVVRHRVVLEHRQVLLLEVWPDDLNQHRTWKDRKHLHASFLAEAGEWERTWPRGPASRRPARGLKGLMMAPMALIHTGMEPWLGLSGRAGNPHGSTNSRCFTLHKSKMLKPDEAWDIRACTHRHTHTHLCGYLSV